MPAVNFDQPIFKAAAAAATDWGSVEGKAESEFTAGAAIKRGYEVEVGLSALAEVDAAFAKFIAAQVVGRASAEARVAVQVQLPLNLFDEAGAAVRVQAVAEAAAGVEAGLGLTIGSFVELAEQIFGGEGLPVRLMLLFLEEVDLTAGVYAKVSASAEAQAYAIIVGTLLDDATRGLKPGFNIVAGAGLGLAAGAGVRLFARADFRDFSRFYANAVDLVVDAIFDEAATRLGNSAGPTLTAALDAARPPFKIAFRLGYDIGDFLANQKPPQNAEGAAALAARATAVIFEESQRYLLRNFAVAGLRQLRSLLGNEISGLDAAGRNRIKPRRNALIGLLRARPENLFDVSNPKVQQFWIDAINDTEALVKDLVAGENPSSDITRALTAAWCATQLLLVAARRATRADASLSVVGLPPQQTHTPFSGSPAADPPDLVSTELASALGIPRPGSGWGLEHAVSYLATVGTITLLETAAPECKPYLDMFQGIFGASSTAVASTILQNIGAVPSASGGAPDPQRTLRDLLGVLQTLVDELVDAQAMPTVRTVLAQSPEALLYLNEVLRPGLDFALGACMDLMLNWSSGAVAPNAATEALSGVILKLLGRTLVVTSDVLQHYTQQQTQALLEGVATDVRSNGVAAKFAALTHLPTDAAADRAADFLRLVGRTLAPYTDSERQEIRNLCFTVLDPVPPAGGPSFVDQLASDSFIPNAEAAGRLAQRTFDLLSERFVAFALGALDLFGSTFLGLIGGALQAATDAVREWIDQAGRALAQAEQRLAELGLEILAATDAAAQFLNDALGQLSAAFGAIGAVSRRAALKSRLADSFVDRVADLLEANPIYRAIPSNLRNGARQSAESIVRPLAEDLCTPVFDAIAGVTSDLSALINDIRTMDPSTPIVSGVTTLILDHIENGIRAAFGGNDPGFTVGFDFAYSLPEIQLLPPGVVMRSHAVHITLGRVELPIAIFVSIIRDVVTSTSGFEAAIEQAAAKFRSWLEKELEAAAKAQEQTGLTASTEVLRADKAAIEGSPRDLWLASPAQAAVYSDLVPVRIVLQDATHDFIDFTRGPQRFFAYLNGAELAVSRFSIETRPALKDNSTVLVSQAAASSAVATARMASRTASARTATDGGIAKPRPSLSRPTQLHVPSTWSLDQVVTARTSPQSAGSLGKAFDRGARIRGVELGGLSAIPRIPAGIAPASNVLKPGARLNDLYLSNVLDNASRTTMTFATELGLNECHAGLNALSITVVAADGSRLTRSVTFIAQAAEKAPSKGGGTRVPAIVLPPRRIPVDPSLLKPKAARPLLDAATQVNLAEAAKRAIVERRVDPAANLMAVSRTLKERLSAQPPPHIPTHP